MNSEAMCSGVLARAIDATARSREAGEHHHPSYVDLAAVAEGSPACDDAEDAVLTHLACCGDCHATVEAIRTTLDRLIHRAAAAEIESFQPFALAAQGAALAAAEPTIYKTADERYEIELMVDAKPRPSGLLLVRALGGAMEQARLEGRTLHLEGPEGRLALEPSPFVEGESVTLIPDFTVLPPLHRIRFIVS